MTPDCQHAKHEDCMNCVVCGKCSETLNDDDICMDCRSKMPTTLPWSINNWHQGDAEIRIGADGTPRIATVHLRDVSINEQRNNAALIVKAVNSHQALVDALTALYTHCCMIHRHWGDNCNRQEANAAIEAGKVALALAGAPLTDKCLADL